ncbi:MAG: CotH kinase family protein [Methanosarcinaceae archaeon]
MKKTISNLVFFSLFFLIGELSIGQTQPVDHWETVIYSNNVWNYLIGNPEPDPNWRELDFCDSCWLAGIGGIGYGDDDDRTIIEPTVSLYLRIKFSIIDTGKIARAVFNIDYDDAFVAYLNDVEIARSNIGIVGDHPPHNQPAEIWTEAQMYQGGEPAYFSLSKAKLRSCLKEGDNILAIQVHNTGLESSDLSSIAFFSVGISDNSVFYNSPPEWFRPPVELSSSNLPIIVINTNCRIIPDDPRIIAHMGIINNINGARNYITDSFNNYNGRISIEIRGSSSQGFPKKSYGLETQDDKGENLNISLLGMPKENDWILYAPYSDKSLLRNVLCFHLGRAMGQYASRTKFCELIIDGNYKGIYVLMEKIKRDKNRVNIAKLKPDEISGDDLTGGYIIKVDKKEGEYSGWYSSIDPPGSKWIPIFFQYYYPKIDEIVPAQKEYIRNFLLDFELALNSDNFTDPENGYANFIDMNSFIDHFIIKEFTKEIDCYRFSTFMYKDKASKHGKLTMGPIWDFNLGFGNVDYGDERAMFTDGWMYDTGEGRMYWWFRMMQDDNFTNKLKNRWIQLREGPFHTDTIRVFLAQNSSYFNEARKRNFYQWPVLGEYVWPNYYVGQSYSDELTFLENWIIDRLNWMDNNMPGNSADISIDENQNALSQNEFQIYPNPFSALTNLEYTLNSSSQVTVIIFNILGRKIKTLVNAYQSKGPYNVTWNGKDEYGNFISNGLFFYTVKIKGNITAKGKIIKQY